MEEGRGSSAGGREGVARAGEGGSSAWVWEGVAGWGWAR